MSQAVIENPIINSRFVEPESHSQFADDDEKGRTDTGGHDLVAILSRRYNLKIKHPAAMPRQLT